MGGGGGGHQRPPGMENLGEWGVQIKDSSVGGMDIFWKHTIPGPLNVLLEKLLPQSPGRVLLRQVK